MDLQQAMLLPEQEDKGRAVGLTPSWVMGEGVSSPALESRQTTNKGDSACVCPLIQVALSLKQLPCTLLSCTLVCTDIFRESRINIQCLGLFRIKCLSWLLVMRAWFENVVGLIKHL